MIDLIPVVPVASAKVDVVVQGEDFAYHYKYSADYWFRFKVSTFPDWSCGRIISVAMEDHDVKPSAIKSVMARTVSGDMVKLYPK
ncbi:hypothetical protein D9M68_18790 [compost metagenome]